MPRTSSSSSSSPSSSSPSASILSRTITEFGNSIRDAYGHVVHGDDPGIHETIVLVLHPEPPSSQSQSQSQYGNDNDDDGDDEERYHLGMSFIEVNDRAYVKNVQRKSKAEKRGIQRRDCLQLAIPGWKLEDLGMDVPPMRMPTRRPRRSNSIDDMDSDDNSDTIIDIEDNYVDEKRYKKCIRYALHCERNGMRTSFDELKTMFEHSAIRKRIADEDEHEHEHRHERSSLGEIDGEDEEIFVSPWSSSSSSSSHGKKMKKSKKKKKKQSFAQKIRSTTQEVVGRCSSLDMSLDGASSPTDHYPVFMVFRHTYSRQQLQQQQQQQHKRGKDARGSKKSKEQERFLTGEMGGKNTAPHVGLPSFRLDDECERASSILRRLAPTADMKYEEDAWDEIAQEATSLLSLSPSSKADADENGRRNHHHDQINKTSVSVKTSPENITTVEASTIRGMIQNALGLAFVRTSKVVLGLSFHFGSGIVISRLEDGTWSAPSAIGMYGAGLGLQFGLEVADYIFVIQTSDALDHFRNGTNYTIGGNMGAAVGGMGREAFGAASLSGTGTNVCISGTATGDRRMRNGDRERPLNLAPIVAYAKSQGLYFGVSLEGSKIFVREDINHRTYQFSTGKVCSTDEILSGTIPPPREAEDLYTTLHNVEFAHEIAQLPRPPDILKSDLGANWKYDTDNIFSKNKDGQFVPLYFLSELSEFGLNELKQFEAEFKSFLCDGISVQRIIPSASGSVNNSLETRTLLLMVPELGSLRVGFLARKADERSELEVDNEHFRSYDSDSSAGSSIDKSNHVEGKLSKKFSFQLTEITSIERCPMMNGANFSNVDNSRLIKIESLNGKTLLFMSNNTPESILLFCGLKLLVEKETIRLGIRGGRPIDQMTVPEVLTEDTEEITEDGADESTGSSSRKMEEENMNTPIGANKEKVNESFFAQQENPMYTSYSDSIPSYDNSGEHGNVSTDEFGQEHYAQGKVMYVEIATNTAVSLPMPLCRALFLDSGSPLTKKWEDGRGDFNYSYGDWKFMESSPRSLLEVNIQEFELIANGKMTGGYRTTSFERMRKGQLITLSERWVVDIDETEKFVFTISERMPRRGFSVKVRIIVRPLTNESCDVSMVGEITPVGKNTSNQSVVHRAFLLLINEVNERYGQEGKGLLAEALQIYLPHAHHDETFEAEQEGALDRQTTSHNSVLGEGSFDTEPEQQISNRRTLPLENEWVEFDSIDKGVPWDKMGDKSGDQSRINVTEKTDLSSTGSHEKEVNDMVTEQVPQTPQRKDTKKKDQLERPATPSMKQRMSNPISGDSHRAKSFVSPINHDFSTLPEESSDECPAIKIDVKPLPKIRLDLVPCPREADEYEEDDF